MYSKRMPVPSLTKQTNKRKLRNMLNDLKPTLVSVPMLILGTHLLFAGIPNIIFLAFTEKGQMTHELIYIKFLLSALGHVVDSALYDFRYLRIRKKIRRIIRSCQERRAPPLKSKSATNFVRHRESALVLKNEVHHAPLPKQEHIAPSPAQHVHVHVHASVQHEDLATVSV